MAQLRFAYNFPAPPSFTRAISVGTMTFFAHNVEGSISLLTINMAHSISRTASADISLTYSLGLYSLSGSTLSIANSLSGAFSTQTQGINLAQRGFISIANTSATQNLTPGTWFWGILVSTTANTSQSAADSLIGGNTNNPANAFPGAFMGGRMTESTNALPGTYATSNLDITGSDAMFFPYILLSS